MSLLNRKFCWLKYAVCTDVDSTKWILKLVWTSNSIILQIIVHCESCLVFYIKIKKISIKAGTSINSIKKIVSNKNQDRRRRYGVKYFPVAGNVDYLAFVAKTPAQTEEGDIM